MTLLTDAEKEGLSQEEISAIEEELEGDNDEVIADDPSKEPPAADSSEGTAEKAVEVDIVQPQISKPFTYPTVDPARIEEAKAVFDEAKQKFDDGEIDFQEFDEAKDAYQRLKWKDEDARDFNKNTRQRVWLDAQDDFFRDNPRIKENRTLHVAYAETVNSMIKTPKGQAMTDAQLLAAAKQKVMADLASIPGVNDVAKQPSVEAEPDPGEFDYLDRLEGQKFQDALEKLSPAQLERYESLM